MQNSSNPNSAGASKPPKRILRKGLLTFATCMALADEVYRRSRNPMIGCDWIRGSPRPSIPRSPESALQLAR
jgi:hypothetical protein